MIRIKKKNIVTAYTVQTSNQHELA